ncbi:MAG: fluoride efflux transporter CrcB [Fibrobacter sp.]|nr:fluoride efflux transporter CrcB [Fibrobacter sp.]
MISFKSFLLVGAGGFIGSMLRYLMTVVFKDFSVMPIGTLISNLSGCFLIGIITGLSIDIPHFSNEVRLFLATGICGGFTTLSSFTYEVGKFARDGEYLFGSLYLIGTLLGAALTFCLGLMLVKILARG